MNKNIIIIFVDAFRAKSLSLFGYEDGTDKNLKKIAQESLFFKKHFSSSNATAPSVTSMFTGKFPNNHGIIHQLPYTKQEEFDNFEKNLKFWLPSYLRDKGYETIAIDWIGLWFKKGFDYYGEWENIDNSVNQRPSKLFSSAKEMTDLALYKIKKNQDKEDKKPFFLFMHFWDTHFPFPNTEYNVSRTEEDFKNTLSSIEDDYQREYLKKRLKGKGFYIIQDIISKYNLSIKNIDGEIGRICDFLKFNRLWDDTILVILGDHGENLQDHGIYFSSSGLYDTTIHVPLIMRLPGVEAKEINELVQNIDIVPTIMDYIGFKKENFDGISLLPLINYNQPVRTKIFSFDGLCENVIAVRTKSRKLIFAKNNFCNLCKSKHHDKIEEYDLESDPNETTNIYSGESELSKYLG